MDTEPVDDDIADDDDAGVEAPELPDDLTPDNPLDIEPDEVDREDGE